MKHDEETMSINELWIFHENIASTLAKKIEDEIDRLQDRLDKLDRKLALPASQRRPYPKVFPKFQNPERPSETWSGRGKQPHWVSDLLQGGSSMDDIRISQTLGAAS